MEPWFQSVMIGELIGGFKSNNLLQCNVCMDLFMIR